jgi:hypothetical protein
MGNTRVSLLDKLLAVPIIVYFWFYKWRQTLENNKEES